MSANLPPLPEPLVMVNRYGLGNATSDGDGGVFTADQMRAYATKAVAAQAAELEALRAQRDIAIDMLAHWCEAVDTNGTGWDDWDEHYKDAAYRPTPIRELINAARAALKEQTPNVGFEPVTPATEE